MFCPSCNYNITGRVTSSYCPSCGALLIKNSQSLERDQVITQDWNLANQIADYIILGKAFAYVKKEIFDQPGLAWTKHFFGKSVLHSQVLSLLGPEQLILPAVSIQPVSVPKLRLASITSDKAIYREKKDDVHLLLLDPVNPDTDAQIEVFSNSTEFSRHSIRFNSAGAATLLLKDLPSGSYEVKFRNAPKEEPACSFTVAEYRLAPLVASLTDRRLEGDKLTVKIRLEAFGVSVNGAVQLELTDRGRRVAINKAEALEGNLETSFTLSGEGPHSINVQLVSDPSRTATIPIVGSRATERKQTPFSFLGTTVYGSLMPGENSQQVRGIFLEEATISNAPFRLERVDSAQARLIASTRAESVCVVAIDHTFPSPRSGAVNPNTATHPANEDEIYRFAEKIFNDGKYAQARVMFEEKRATLSSPHPNYAYYIACCYAREGDCRKAVAALRLAIEDGWIDFAHMINDDDLANLRDYPPYEMLKTGGRKQFNFEMLTSGDVIEIDIPAPTAILAIGAYIEGKAWEGWAAVVSPSEIMPKIKLPEVCRPSSEIKIEVELESDSNSAVYLIVKDARLLSSDTASSRLAGQIKELVEKTSQKLMLGNPEDKLRNYISQPMLASIPMPTAMRSIAPVQTLGLTPMPMMPVPASAPGAGAIPVAEAFLESTTIGAAPVTAGKSSFPTGSLKKAMPSVSKSESSQDSEGQGTSSSKPTTVEDPEVLFADLVEVKNGLASITLELGDAFADYIVEAFAISGLDWASSETRFRAEKEVFADLDIPLFVHPSDTAIGRVHLGSTSGQIQVIVTCDKKPVQLVYDGRSLDQKELINASRAEVSFLAVAGDYEVMAEDPINKRVDYVAKRINIPGKFKYLSKALCFVREGEKISLEPNSDVIGLRVMPSLDKPFQALVDATSNYGHACCEQTAAIMLSACAMYSFAGADIKRRSQAEGIIIAGVRREKSMWLKGRGFKMYPESSNQPNDYYGPKAARYLWNLSLLREIGRPSPALAKAIEEGLEMAKDASAAYKLDWPPKNPNTCEEAYAAVRFSSNAKEQALKIVRKYADNSKTQLAPVNDHYYGGSVGRRAEASFAAATLFRAGMGSDHINALALTNKVVKDLGENGRLYSTLDSVAAIALMSELQAAKVVSGSGKLEINASRVSRSEAITTTDKIESINVIEGVIPVEITRIIEEDWSSFNSTIPIKVSVEKDGRAQRQINVGDAISLKVKLNEGYKVGDLLWVCLPEALSRIVGGGQVKKFSIDFEGKDEVVVSLAATSITVNKEGAVSPQHFAVCLRNMFEEERGANPGLLEITVAPSGSSGNSILGRALVAFRNMFS
ncbi:MAG: hypothetical protein HY819_04555 [Acidobacteria bacterium]|nr:hypothetical protein [Acidobacteriota bacterium]